MQKARKWMRIRAITERKRGRLGVALLATVALSAGLYACGGGDSTSSSSSGGDEVQTLSLQGVWVPGDTSLGGMWVAEEKGYLEEEGVKIDYKPGGTVEPTQLVLGGSSDIGINAATSLLQARAKGAPIKVFGCGFQNSPLGIVTHKDKGIDTFADLKGRKIGVDSISQPLLEAFLLANGIKADEVHLTTIAAGLGQFLSNQVEAQLSYINSEPRILEEEGVEINVFAAGENNFELPDYCFFAAEKTLKDPAKREAIEAFMRATTKGWEDVEADPAAAAATVASLQKGADKKLVQSELEEDVKHFIVAPGSSQPIFGVTIDQFETLIEQLHASGFLAEDEEVTAEELLEPSLIPGGAS